MGTQVEKRLDETLATLFNMRFSDEIVVKAAAVFSGIVARWPHWEERSRDFSQTLVSCGRLLDRPLNDPLVVQITRVVIHILLSRADWLSYLCRPNGIVQIFRSYGLIPPRLKFYEDGERQRQFESAIDRVTAWLGSDNPDTSRVLFAACAYPQKLSQMGWPMAERRMIALGDFLAQWRPDSSVVGAMNVRLSSLLSSSAWSMSSTRDLLRDLSGDVAPVGSLELDGAALYLATCSDEEIERIHRVWAREGELVRTFRSYFAFPPSSYAAKADQGAKPSVLEQLAITEVGKNQWFACMQIEKHARSIARGHWPAGFQTDEHFTNAWQGVHARWLSSGFPYFAFRADIHTWWIDYISRFRFDRNNPLDDRLASKAGDGDDDSRYPVKTDVEAASERLADKEADIDMVRVFREGFRLVRTTFFSRDDRDHDRIRRAVDALWRFYFEKKLFKGEVEWGDLGPLIKRIANGENLAFGKVETAYNKLTLRMWAYTASRTEHFPLDEIQKRKCPRGYKGGKEYPLADNATALTIAALARMAPRDFTLLWGMTAYVFLRPAINAIYDSDTWSIDRYSSEVCRWFCNPAFARTLAYGRENERRVDTLCEAALLTGSLKGFYRRVTGTDPHGYMEESGGGRPVLEEHERNAVRTLICNITGCRIWNVSLDRIMYKGWIDWPHSAPSHLVIPVWYLALAENMDDASIAKRMGVNMADISGLAMRIRTYAAARDDIAVYAVGNEVSPEALVSATEILEKCKPGTLKLLRQNLASSCSLPPSR